MKTNTSNTLPRGIRYYDRGVTVALEIEDWEFVVAEGGSPKIQLALACVCISGDLTKASDVDERQFQLDSLAVDLVIDAQGQATVVLGADAHVLEPIPFMVLQSSLARHVSSHAPELCLALAELAQWRNSE